MKRPTVKPPTLVLADDNSAMLSMLVEILQDDYSVAAALPNGTAVLAQVATLNPDLIILDVSLGDISGFEVARCLKDSACTARIIFLTVHEDIEFVNAAFDIGVAGYVFKSRISEDLAKTIDIVFKGGRYASSTLPPEK